MCSDWTFGAWFSCVTVEHILYGTVHLFPEPCRGMLLSDACLFSSVSYAKYCTEDVLVFIMQETVRNLDEAAIAEAALAPVATFASPTAVRCVLASIVIGFYQFSESTPNFAQFGRNWNLEWAPYHLQGQETATYCSCSVYSVLVFHSFFVSDMFKSESLICVYAGPGWNSWQNQGIGMEQLRA